MIAVFLADGFEEVEALTPVDYLRRAGISVATVAVTGKTAVGSHGVGVICDMHKEELLSFDDIRGVILPGGMPGTLNLEKDDVVRRVVEHCAAQGKMIAAICAAPSVLGHMGLLEGREAICYPGFENELYGAKISQRSAVTDGNIITAKGAGAAGEFAFEIISYLKDSSAAEKIRAAVQYA